jgi:hypothetical protein
LGNADDSAVAPAGAPTTTAMTTTCGGGPRPVAFPSAADVGDGDIDANGSSSNMVDAYVALAMKQLARESNVAALKGLKWVKARVARFRTYASACPACDTPRCLRTRAWFSSTRKTRDRFVAASVLMAMFFPIAWRAANVDDDYLLVLQLVLTACMATLAWDFLACCLESRGYLFGFYFCIDVCSTTAVLAQFPALNADDDVYLLAAQFLIARMLRVLRVTTIMPQAFGTRELRLMKMLRVQSFTETSTNGAVLGVLAIASILPLLTFDHGTPMWADLMASTLARLNPRSCDFLRTAAPSAAHGEAATVVAAACEAALEAEVMNWFTAVEQHPEGDRRVLYLIAHNRTFLNPYAMAAAEASSASSSSWTSSLFSSGSGSSGGDHNDSVEATASSSSSSSSVFSIDLLLPAQRKNVLMITGQAPVEDGGGDGDDHVRYRKVVMALDTLSPASSPVMHVVQLAALLCVVV